MVPVRNAWEFQKATGGKEDSPIEIFLYGQSGHDLDNDLSVKRTREFLMKTLGNRKD